MKAFKKNLSAHIQSTNQELNTHPKEEVKEEPEPSYIRAAVLDQELGVYLVEDDSDVEGETFARASVVKHINDYSPMKLMQGDTQMEYNIPAFNDGSHKKGRSSYSPFT